jgi:XTP/dITP diphosphohydrolase
MSKQLVIATHNAGKLAEMKALLANEPLRLVSLAELNVPEPEETGLSFVENAILKARHAAEITGLPALADDSGLVVEALGGAPGIYSARYAAAKDNAANIAKLLHELKTVPKGKRNAHFCCVIALMRHAKDPMPLVLSGVLHGEILDAQRGNGGFGYDPVFWLPDVGRSVAELSPEEKNAISHRAQALKALKLKLQEALL